MTVAAPEVPSPAPGLDEALGAAVTHLSLPRWWGRQHVVVAGPEDVDRTLVLLHGWPQHWWAWRHVIAASVADTRIVAIDTRGFGWSEVEPAAEDRVTARSLAADVVATMDDLDVASAHVAGHDWGGWFAFRVAIDHPRRVRSTTAAAIMPPWLVPGQVRRHAGRLAYLGPMAARGDRVARSPSIVRRLLDASTADRSTWRSPDGARAVATYTDRLLPVAAARATRLLYRRMVAVELRRAMGPRPGPLAAPASVLLGDQESISHRAMYEARGAPREITTHVIPGCGHWMLDEAPDAVVAHLRTVLDAAP